MHFLLYMGLLKTNTHCRSLGRGSGDRERWEWILSRDESYCLYYHVLIITTVFLKDLPSCSHELQHPPCLEVHFPTASGPVAVRSLPRRVISRTASACMIALDFHVTICLSTSELSDHVTDQEKTEETVRTREGLSWGQGSSLLAFLKATLAMVE